MLDGNTAALDRYLDEQDRLESLVPSEGLVHQEQADMYHSRLQDTDYTGDALLVSDMNEGQLRVFDAMCHAVADEKPLAAGMLLAQLLRLRLYPSYEEAETKLIANHETD